MFYYPDVLQRHSGCFSTIWLVATKGIKVNRRELLRVNVKKSCMDIMDYVTAQVPPPQPNQPKPRFSLYLMSQLHYGVVVVYHRQCGFLLDEIQQTIDRLLRFKRCVDIDMAEPDSAAVKKSRMGLDVPDHLNMMEMAEGAQDPFFGNMNVYQLPSSLFKIHPAQFVIEERSLVAGARSAAEGQGGFRSPAAAITLTESEHFVITDAQYFEGDDLAEATTKEIDLLMDQPDLFRGGEEPQREGAQAEEPEGVGSFIDQMKETMVATEQVSTWPLDQESSTGTLAREIMPPLVAMPTTPSEASGKDGGRAAESPGEVAVGPIRKPAGSRRRQLVFIDPIVQISDRVMKERVENRLAETLLLSEVQLDFLSLTWLRTPAQLFSAPCGRMLHGDLLSQWKDATHLAVLPGRGEQLGGEQEEEQENRAESEQDKEILREERKRRPSCMKEMSSDSGLQPPSSSSASVVILEVSKEDRSVSDVFNPVGRWSPHEESQPPMEPIAEELIKMPEADTDTGSRDTLSCIASLQRFGEVTFNLLLPPGANRVTAAHTLIELLELLSAGQVTARQADPYGDITVTSP